MKLFKKKPVIKVISVQHEKRMVTEEATDWVGSLSRDAKKKTKDVSFTIVLMSKDGELCTREFNGTWNLADIKKWEDL